MECHLARHVKFVHMGAKRVLSHKCPECPEAFYEKSRLNRHLSEAHGSLPKRFKCPHCDLTTYFKSSLNYHILTKHETEKMHKCKQCPSFRTHQRSELQRHIDSVHRQIRHQCTKCDKSYSTRTNLRIHIKAKHESTTFKCDVCDFRTTTTLLVLGLSVCALSEGAPHKHMYARSFFSDIRQTERDH